MVDFLENDNEEPEWFETDLTEEKESISEVWPDFKETNHVWCFDIKTGEFKKYDLKHMVAGDTDSGYFNLPIEITEDDTIDDIVGLCDSIAEEVDSAFPEFVKMAFNCPEERKDTVKTDREVVADRSFFVTKKRYAMRVIDDEGKRVNKTKMMGLEIKKADTATSVKAFLKKMVTMVLDGCDRDDLLEAKKQFKEEFFQMGIRDISPAMPANRLADYERQLEAQGNMKGFPYHMRAALHYNSLCGVKDRKIYVGEKFYVCNIKGSKSKYISMPVDLNRTPEIVESVIIDYQVMWKKAEKKINNYMKALGWDIAGMVVNNSTSIFGIETGEE